MKANQIELKYYYAKIILRECVCNAKHKLFTQFCLLGHNSIAHASYSNISILGKLKHC